MHTLKALRSITNDCAQLLNLEIKHLTIFEKKEFFTWFLRWVKRQLVTQDLTLLLKVLHHVKKELAIQDPQLLYRYAMTIHCFYLKDKNVYYLKHTLVILEKLSLHYPKFFTSFAKLYERAQLCFECYVHSEDSLFLQHSLLFFSQAQHKIERSHTRKSLFYWQWAKALSYLGILSSEPSDSYQSIEKYICALQTGIQEHAFYVDLAQTLLSTSMIEWKIERLFHAKEYIQQALNNLALQNISYDAAWESYLHICTKIATMTADPEHIQLAFQAFHEAMLHTANHTSVELQWIHFLLYIGWQLQEITWLEEVIEKLTSAQKALKTCYLLAEGLLKLSILLEDYELLRTSEKCLYEAGIQSDLTPEGLYVHACLHYAYGDYFEEKPRLEQALSLLKTLMQQHPLVLKYQELYLDVLITCYTLTGCIEELSQAIIISQRHLNSSPYHPIWIQKSVTLLTIEYETSKNLSALTQALELIQRLPDQKAEYVYLFLTYAYELGCIQKIREGYFLLESLTLEDIPDTLLIKIARKNVELACFVSERSLLITSMQWLHKALKIATDSAALWFDIGYVYILQLLLDKKPLEGSFAEKAWIHAARLGYPNIHFYLTLLYVLAGHIDAAWTHYQHVEDAKLSHLMQQLHPTIINYLQKKDRFQLLSS